MKADGILVGVAEVVSQGVCLSVMIVKKTRTLCYYFTSDWYIW